MTGRRISVQRRAARAASILRAIGRGAGAALILATGSGCNDPNVNLFEQMRRSVAETRVQRGHSLMEHEHLNAAIREFDEALRLSPQLASAHSGLGQVYRKRGDLSEAARHFAEAVRLDPADFPSTLSLAETYQKLAETAIDRLDKLRQAVRAYLHACELRPEHFEAHLNAGVCYHQMGDLDQAISFYRAAIKIDPSNAFALANLGAAYDTKGRYYDAINAYKRALELEDNQPMVLVNLGTTYLKQGRINAGVAAFRRAIQIEPTLAIAHQRLGYCYYRNGAFDQALAAYGRSIELDAKSAEAHAGRGVVFMTMYLRNKSRLELRTQALDHWHRSLELDSNQPRLKSLLAKYAPPSRAGGSDVVLVGP
ncbi:MAG: tetratricopeptide repeat protein [Phycisphaerae bacterium]|nr:tetratricopeptide repeat protein [Phycisphaerae bacterium]